MGTETIKWWIDGQACGAYRCVHDDEGNIIGECNSAPDPEHEVDEATFAAFLRSQHIATSDAFNASKALGQAEIDAAGVARQGKISELVTAGISAELADELVSPAPTMSMAESYSPPEGSGDVLRSQFYLSQESIETILAPI